jgi:predicted flap endonuclease-1-like 5' DNA nuclease
MRWIIDEIYSKDNLRMITNENEYLRDRIRALEALRSSQRIPEQQPIPTPQPPERTLPASTPAPQLSKAPSRKDDLKMIKGVGPKLEEKLNKAGVRTFDQLSQLTAEELQRILGTSKRATQNADNLISQAKKFAQEGTNR